MISIFNVLEVLLEIRNIMHNHFKNNFNYYHNILYLFILKLWPFYEGVRHFCRWCCRPRPWANLHVAINMKVSDSIIMDLDVCISHSRLCLVVLSLPRRRIKRALWSRGVQKTEESKKSLQTDRTVAKILVRFGFGFHFIKTENFSFGFSVPHKYTDPTETEPKSIKY